MLPNQLIDRLIFPAEYMARVGASGFNRKPVGTGAYKFVEWVPGQRFVAEANDAYWDGRPQIDRVEVFPIPEPSTRVAAIFAGDLDIIEKPPMEYMQRLRANRELAVLTYPTLAILTFVINTKIKPLDDVRVRRAIQHAVNIDEMIVKVLGGIGKRSQGLLVPGMPGHNPDLKPYEYNPDKARQFLREAGYPDGFPLKVYTPTGRYFQDVELAEAVAGYLNRVNIKAQVTPIEWGTLVLALAGKPMLDGMYMIGNSQYSLDPAGTYQGYVWSDFRGVYYSRSELDELGRQARTAADPKRRAQLYQRMEEIVWNDAFWLPLTVRVEILVIRRSVDFTPRQTEYLYLREAKIVR
jgi:peptide/nickel transport system substrate-binding protein